MKKTMEHQLDLSGIWSCRIQGTEESFAARIPGTLEESGIGFPDRPEHLWNEEAGNAGTARTDGKITTRFTRTFTYEGPATFTRSLELIPGKEERVFLEVERARKLSLEVNGTPVPAIGEACVSAPHVFEITGLLTGKDEITLRSDNSYPDWPRDGIVYSSAATDETQTNWNGLLGRVCLWRKPRVFLREILVYPREDRLEVRVTVDAAESGAGTLTLMSDCLQETVSVSLNWEKGTQEFRIPGLRLREDALRWDLEEGYLYEMTAKLGEDERKVCFGIRDFGVSSTGRLTLNGRVVFLRGEVNCCVFPETGHAPMTVSAWQKVLETYRGYGVNFVRFHSHVPPEAAFIAADQLGMLLQPELAYWNPKDAFESETDRRYYRGELRAVLRHLANHPSFVMMTWGNELFPTEEGLKAAGEMTAMARTMDPTRLYAIASNPWYGARGCDPFSDFYTSQRVQEEMLRATSARMRGHLNQRYPDAKTDYEPAMKLLRQTCTKPVLAFEVGQYEVLPDFDELADFHGITCPVNYEIIRERMRERGLEKQWKRMVEATGELALIGYREEAEAALRTESLSGMSLLGLQDFPGQGTALVGMLNAHLNSKPFSFAAPERFRAFYRDMLPLVMLEKYTWEEGDVFRAEVKIANYGRQDMLAALHYELKEAGSASDGKAQQPETGIIRDSSASGETILTGKLPATEARAGCLTSVGILTIPIELREKGRAEKLALTVTFGEARNTYPLWVYPAERPVRPEGIYQCKALDTQAEKVLAEGGIVYLAPPSTREALPASIQGQFSTDFWSVGTFPFQEGGMGQLIDAAHPIFRDFPTESHTNWQWWPMASQRAVILPEEMDCIVREMDSYAFLRPMAQLLECRCGEGRLLLSTFGLDQLQQYPEARALQHSIWRYLASEDFQPEQELAVETIRALVRPEEEQRTCQAGGKTL